MILRTLHRAMIPALLLCAAGLAPSLVHASPPNCAAIGRFVDRFLANHISHHVLTPELQGRTVDSFLRSFDPTQSILIDSEVQKLREELGNVFGRIDAGNCMAIAKVHRTFSESHERTEKFVAEFVRSKDYEIDESVSLLLDAKERGYPKTEAERDALILDLMHFQMANYVNDETTLDKAKDLLIHRYELRSKRIAKLDTEDVYSAFLNAFATSLDPHSNYMSADGYEDFRISMSLSLNGIGVALSERDGFAVVERVLKGGAAAKLGVLRPKDKIIEVAQEDGEPVNIIDMPLRDAVSLIRGRKGTTVRLTVLRQGDTTESFPVSIVRDEISLEDQAASLRFEEREIDGEKLKLAILELPSFYGATDPSKRQCTDDVARLLREVNEADADGLVLDLSRNGGGLLSHAVTMSGFFLRRGEIVKVQNSRGQQEVLSDRDSAILYRGPLVVHTSRVSASAAEILAGALKDYKRAVIAGDDHTFGKGTVQTVSSLDPGQGALKITTQMFYRPGGKSTQHRGVEADVLIPSLFSEDFGEMQQPYSIEGKVIASFQGSYANANPASGRRWKVVSSETVGKLSALSQKRVSESEDFAEVAEKLKEAREKDGMIHLKELLERRKKDDDESDVDVADNPDAADDEEEDEPTPQLEEAVNVLVDLIAVNSLPKSGIAATRARQ